MRFVTLLFLLLSLAWVAPEATAQFEDPVQPCDLGAAEARLRGADVEAALFTNGNLFFGNTTTNGDGYLVPRTSENSPLYASNLWVGGVVGGEVRVVGSRYTNFALRPGQTGDDGTAPTPEACAEADRIWVVSREDVEDYLSGAAPSADLAEWPIHLGAPVLDGDGIAGNYDLAFGDQPAIRGDVMAFWAMTDTAANLAALGNPPLGIDVAVEAFAFRQASLGEHTFYNVTVTNRNRVPIDSAYVGLFLDADLGGAADDYVGTDTTAHLHYYYNADDSDGVYPIPPAFGAVVARGPVSLPNGRDDDRDGEVDEPGERLGLTASSNFEGSRGPTADPTRGQALYYFLQGLWGDGTPMRANGNGYGQPTQYPVTPFVFPGDPVTEEGWSEVNNDGEGTDNGRGDRSGSMATGPFRLASGASDSILLALAFAQGSDRLNSIRVLRGQARGIRSIAASGGFEPSRVSGPAPPGLPLAVGRPRPNPFSGNTAIEVRGAAPEATLSVAVYDVLGRLVRAPEAVEAPRARIEVGEGLASGVYVVRVEGRGFSETFTVVKTQ